MKLPRLLGRNLTAQLLLAQLAVIVVGAATLTAVAYAVGPTLFHRHIRRALGVVPAGVAHHLDTAFAQSLALSLGIGIGVAALTAAVVSWILASRIVGPMRGLAAAARELSRGDYAARVQIEGPDELTVLAHSFNEMASALDSAEQRRRRLFTDLAHELRTPLATIDAYLEGLADGITEPAPETWTLLRAQTARLDRLTDDIAKVSRAEERQLDLHTHPIPTRELLAAAAAAARPGYADKGVSLELEPTATRAAVDVDSDRLGEVLGNLLDNALRHTPAGGTVTLAAAATDDEVILSVSDTGEGIEPDELEHVFERFYRADQARSRDRGGSGIGLTIARALVEAHDGRINAESRGAGRGSIFQVALPRTRGRRREEGASPMDEPT